MWLQIILSILLAVVAARFLMYMSSHERIRVLQENEDFTVRYPRTYLWIGIVLYALAGSVALSLIIWANPDVLGIVAAGALGAAGTVFFLRAQVWHIDVRRQYLIFVSAVGVKRLIHFDDIVNCMIDGRVVNVETLIKSFRMSTTVIYLEDFLGVLAANHVPIYRDTKKKK